MMLIGVHRLSWISPLSSSGWIALAVCCVLTWLLLQLFWGKALTRVRPGLRLLRAAAVAVALLIIMGPTIVDEKAGVESRPMLFYLFDSSQSMQLGGETTRWQECIRFLEQSHRLAGPEHAHHFNAFRFGHQLRPLGNETTLSQISDTQTMNFDGVAPPDATDSRLADALRQLSPQIDPKNNAGLVVFSDGRVRATESVERLAEHFGKSGIPIHVVPVGELQGTGDVAIVSMVVEPRLRKYTENQLTLFLRSFGFTGERTVVKVINRSKIADGAEEVLAELPITLGAGAQSVTLSFRVEDRPQDLSVVVEPLKGELTARNNRVETRVEIDRTKLRVLYIEGEVAATQSFLSNILNFGGGSNNTGQNSRAMNIREALQADEDIECTVLINRGLGQFERVAVNDATISLSGFPKTRAELFAFDCVVLSNVGPDNLEEQQAQQLALWVEGRGGGLIVTGTQSLEARAWEDNPLAPLMPIEVDKLLTAFPQATPVKVSNSSHPIWRLRLEQSLNQQLLTQLPPLTLGVSGIKAKPTAEVLATVADAQAWPVLVAHRAGRGRVVVSTADLGGTALMKLSEQWGPQPERVASKLWRNMVYWATEGSSVGRRRLVANSDKRFYRPGDKLSIDAVAYDESARKSQKYKLWAMLEPMSLEESSLYSPVLWPENVVRESGEVGPRVAWGEEIPLPLDATNENYLLNLTLSEATGAGDSGMRIEMTAYEGEQSSAGDHGTQVDSSSLTIQVLSDPFEQQNPLPNRELLTRLSSLSGGRVLEKPADLANLLESRSITRAAPRQDISPAWSKWWLWLVLLGLLTGEWIWRRTTGMA